MKFFVMIILMVGALAPAVFSQSDYLMFASYFDENKSRAFDMDTSGNITLRNDYTVGKYSRYVTSSPNGRLVLVSTSHEPRLSCFFINRDRSIMSPIYNNEFFTDYYQIPVCFNAFRSYMYVGWYPKCQKFQINYSKHKIYATEDSVSFDSISSEETGYSIFLQTFIHGISLNLNQKIVHGAGTVNINIDGSFTTKTNSLILGDVGGNTNFTTSPNGRWAVLLGNDDPEMSIVGINKDGSLYLVEQWDFPGSEVTNPEMVRYTPDGKHLILLHGGSYALFSFSVDQNTGKLTKIDQAAAGTGMCMAITPDSRFIVALDVYYYGSLQKTTLHVYELEENGKINPINKNALLIDGYPSDMEFVPPWQETPFPQNGFMLYGQQEVTPP